MDAERAPVASSPTDFDAMRVGYAGGPGAQRLDVADCEGGWAQLLSRWLSDAASAGVREPNAMVLATVSDSGRPSTRTVLLKGIVKSDAESDAGAAGLRFFTSHSSRKGAQLAANGVAAVTFLWLEIERQVHFEGACHAIGPEESARYWATRPRGSQVAAWASHQSDSVASLAELDALLAATTTRFADTEEIPMPERWGGYLLVPDRVEFWRGGRDRFHDRILARRTGITWVVERLQP